MQIDVVFAVEHSLYLVGIYSKGIIDRLEYARCTVTIYGSVQHDVYPAIRACEARVEVRHSIWSRKVFERTSDRQGATVQLDEYTAGSHCTYGRYFVSAE